MALKLREYWAALEGALTKFDATHDIKVENKQDQAAYEQQRGFLELMLQHGIAVENAPLLSKQGLAAPLQTLPKATFGEAKVPTTFGGRLSVTFAEQVYLPHLQRFADVTMDDQGFLVRNLCNLAGQKKDTAVLVATLDRAIQDYKAQSKATSVLVGNSMFEPKQGDASVAVESDHLVKIATL